MIHFPKNSLHFLNYQIFHRLTNGNLPNSKFIHKNCLYSTRPTTENSFCLNACTFGSKFDLVRFNSELILILFFLIGSNRDFIEVFDIY